MRKEIPVSEPEESEDDPVYLFPSASWGDMTGLIPADCGAPGEGQEYAAQAYGDVFPFRADTGSPEDLRE